MRIRTRTLLMIGVLAFVATAVLWRLGDARFSLRRGPALAARTTTPIWSTLTNRTEPRVPTLPASMANTAIPAAGAAVAPATAASPVSLRLRNSDRPIQELSRDDRAVSLRNALIDTTSDRALEIPSSLKAEDEPGAFIVQSKGSITPAFQEALREAGTRIVSYIPHNAHLVMATAAQAARLRGVAAVGAVLPFEPYFKLEPKLLERAIRDESLAAEENLTITAFPGSSRASIDATGLGVVAEFPTPFGPGFVVQGAGVSLASIARNPAVQVIEPFRERQLLNDRTRRRFGISSGTNAPGVYTNYLGLTGTNVVVNVNDSGVDESHPDLKGRVTGDVPSTLVDFNGHGTHVAGTIAGSGIMSGAVSNAPGSIVPGADFRGMAPAAELYAIPIDLDTGPLISDAYLQRNAATNHYVTHGRTNLLISNNSWGYVGAFEYTTASASYDAAVRDALPDVTGSQPILYVFAAGNEGLGADDGQGGEPNSVRAPGSGKNVITVGAVESLRNITNEVVSFLPDGTLTTNQVFLPETDSEDQVTSFSGRGNIEPGIEGDFGRFKPDVVAPGAFTISARSQDWVDPEFFTSVQVNRIENQSVSAGDRVQYSLFIPDRVSEFRIRLLRNDRSPNPLPGLPIYLNYGNFPSDDDLVGTNNIVIVPPEDILRAGDWFYSVGNFGDQAVSYDVQTLVVITNGNFGYFQQLKQLNSGMAPNYRFESGTSMAAPAVSGLIALYQEYFQRDRKVASPALLKALLINGARSLGSHYNFNLREPLNLQGWGHANITNALPTGEFGSPTGSVFGVQYIDVTGTNALASGQVRSWRVEVSPDAQDQILKFTLVWTDPPGNPISGIKLVNDLDLVVKNLATGEEYIGNDIPFRSDFNIAHPEGTGLTNDIINNVENVLLRPPVGTNYLLTVRGRRVNVNAVTTQTNGIAQDFALVASVANTTLTNVLNIRPETTATTTLAAPLIALTNGLPYIGARAGAISPLLGAATDPAKQWTFFVLTNLSNADSEALGLTNGQYVTFFTFGSVNLSIPRQLDGDIDLYVTTDGSITNLNPVAIRNAFKSQRRGSSEFIFFTNAPLGAVYYLGVKAEDQQAAAFSIAGLSSDLPFDQEDDLGNRIVRGLPPRMPIPDGSPDQPQAGYVFGIVTESFPVRQVTVTNTLAFDSSGDIHVNLGHNQAFAVLNNHALDPSGRGGIRTTIYDDSGTLIGSGGVFARPSDGPGSLQNFVSDDALGPWILTLSDNALTQVSTNLGMFLHVQRDPVGNELFFLLRPGEWIRWARQVPSAATNIILTVTDINGTPGKNPLEVYLRRLIEPSLVDYDKFSGIPAGQSQGFLTLGLGDVPPLNPGLYHAGVYNPGPNVMSGTLRFDWELDPNLAGDSAYAATAPLPILDDATVSSRLPVADDRIISDVRVGVRVDHPRVSDLVFRLISPQGTRFLLSENRGGDAGKAYGADLSGNRRIFTTFTDDTNLTVTPIKFGVAAFTNNPLASTASNRVIMSDSFDKAISRTYLAGETIVPGWRVLRGQASVVRVPVGGTNRYDGDQYLTMAVGSSVATNVILTPGTFYRIRFGTGRLAGMQPQGLQVLINGTLLQELKSDDLRSGWYDNAFLFGATARQNVLEFRGTTSGEARLPLAMDGVVLEDADPPLNSFYLPEERLRPLIGQRALGDWRLEITDSRAGPEMSIPPVLHDWRLELDFDIDAFNAIRLTNGIPYFGSVTEDEIQYFYVDAPVCSTIAVNTLAGELGTLLLFGDRDGLPRADLSEFVDDYGPYLNFEAGGRATLTLTTNVPNSAPLRPGQRYFLAVRNFQPDRSLNSFGIMVQFDCEDPPLPIVPSLTNGVPRIATIEPGPGLHYYQINISSNAIRADFELTPLSGNNVDMYIKRGRVTPPDQPDPQPLPSPNSFDYFSDLPGGTEVDFVGVGRTSQPEGLVPGIWFIGVINGDVVPAQYSLKVTETYATIVNLTNNVAFTNSIAPNPNPLLGVQGDQLQYYAFLVSSNSVQAAFETLGADGNVDLFVRRGLPIPTPSDFHFAGQNSGAVNEFIAVTNTTTPIWLEPGWWFLSVANSDVTNVTYSIRATETPATITPLVNDVPVTRTLGPGPTPDYYSFTVSPSALSAKFELYGLSADVNLLLRRGLPVPTVLVSDYQSNAPGIFDEVIELTPFSFPIGLTPGDWYLSVVNPGSGNADYTIKATESTAVVTVLSNGVPHNAAIPAGGRLDYFQFEIFTNALAAEFKLTSAGTGNLDLFLKKGPPLPNAQNADYVQASPGNVDELIRLEPSSRPVPLSPGIWYLAVTNNQTVPISYEITATQFGIEPPPPSGNVTNISISDTNICITWISIPSTNYYVVGKTNALDAAWTPISPTITAVATSTTWCLDLPSPWRFFDVLEGESPLVPIPAPVPVLRLNGSDICVGFASVVGTNYYIQAKKVSTDPAWVTLTSKVTATTAFTEICYPLEWGYRFFQVGVGEIVPDSPIQIPPALVSVELTVDSLCVSWPTRAGLDYLVEGKRLADDPNWSVISEPIRGDGLTARLCLDPATVFRFFRVTEGVSVPPGAPPSLPVPNFRLTADAAFQLCLVWDTLVGSEYFVEAKERFTDPAWKVISPILEASGIQLSYCIPLNSTWRYFQLRRINRAPGEPPKIAEIQVVPTGLRLRWTGSAGARYQVFYTDAFPATAPDKWLRLGDPVTSVTTSFEYIDTGVASGGFSGFRVYRIEMLP